MGCLKACAAVSSFYFSSCNLKLEIAIFFGNGFEMVNLKYCRSRDI